MTERDVLKLHDEAPDDAEVGRRVAAIYDGVPAPAHNAIEHCVKAVLSQAQKTANPFRIQQRWWWGGAAAAVLVIAVTLRSGLPGDGNETSDTTLIGNVTSINNGQAVQFDLHLPKDAAKQADKVSVVGDFNGWDAAATPMAQGKGKGTWSAKVPLTPGRHVYAYVINGERWMVDPLAPQVPDAGYGPANALVVEGGPK